MGQSLIILEDMCHQDRVRHICTDEVVQTRSRMPHDDHDHDGDVFMCVQSRHDTLRGAY